MKDSYRVTDDTGEIVAMAFLTRDVGEESTYILNRVVVKHDINRGHGYGNILMRKVCSAADKENIALWLGVESDYPLTLRGLTDEQLIVWYTSWGFDSSEGDPCFMIREPYISACDVCGKPFRKGDTAYAVQGKYITIRGKRAIIKKINELECERCNAKAQVQ